MLAVTKSPFSVQMITSLSGDVKPCLLHPYTTIGRGRKKKTLKLFEKSWGRRPGCPRTPGVMVYHVPSLRSDAW